jgi:hypothetical protein
LAEALLLVITISAIPGLFAQNQTSSSNNSNNRVDTNSQNGNNTALSEVSWDRLELAGGYAHTSGNFGLDGYNVSAAWGFTSRIMLAADLDDLYDHTRIGAFDFTSVGPIATNSRLSNLLVGPRVFFSPQQIKDHIVLPFVEGQFGVSRLRSTIQDQTRPAVTAHDTAFTWMLGGGAEYTIDHHWAARGKLDLLRTHFINEGQSRLRLALGVTYTVGGRRR